MDFFTTLTVAGWRSYTGNADRVRNETNARITASNPWVNETAMTLAQKVWEADQDELRDLMLYADPVAEVRRRYKMNWGDPIAAPGVHEHAQNLIALIQSDNKGFQHFSYNDFVLDGVTVSVGSDAREKQYNRQMVNKQIGNIFAEAGISVPDGERFIFTVTEDHYIHVKGGDETLASRMEAALNQNGNGRELAAHLKLSCSGSHGSDWRDDIRKRMIYRYDLDKYIRQFTPYSLSDFTRDENGKFRTPDGRSAWSVFQVGARDYAKSHDWADADHTADGFREWFETIESDTEGYYPAFALSIEFRNGSLYDIGQSEQYGDGMTDWIDELEKETITFSFASGRSSYYEYSASPKERKQEVLEEQARRQAQDSLRSLLSSVGAAVQQTQGLFITLDSSGSFRVRGDDGLWASLEKALNERTEGKALAGRLLYCVDEEQRDAFISALQKTLTEKQIEAYTGLHLTDCKVQSGRYVTPDGQDLFNAYRARLLADPTARYAALTLSYVGAGLRKLAAVGYDAVRDTSIRVRYQDGQLRVDLPPEARRVNVLA